MVIIIVDPPVPASRSTEITMELQEAKAHKEASTAVSILYILVDEVDDLRECGNKAFDHGKGF